MTSGLVGGHLYGAEKAAKAHLELSKQNVQVSTDANAHLNKVYTAMLQTPQIPS